MVNKQIFRTLHTTFQCCKSVRLNNAKGVSSAQWLTRQLSDPYIEKAKKLNYRCRSAFKLIEMDDRFRFLRPGQVVVDCGAAPGSWTQVAVTRVNADNSNSDSNSPVGTVIAIDKQHIYPINGALVLSGSDFTLSTTRDKIKSSLGDKRVDVVLSDMAPNATGIKEMDDENVANLCYLALRFALLVSNADAVLVVKLWQSEYAKVLGNDMLRFYKSVKTVKPQASRSDSAELFLLARDFKGLKSS